MAVKPPASVIQWAFDEGHAKGDVNYWLSLPESSPEWDHFLNTIREPLVAESFTNRGARGDPNYWRNLSATSREWSDLFAAFGSSGSGGGTGGGTGGAGGTNAPLPPDPDPAPPTVGGSAEYPGALRGGTLVRVSLPGADDLYLMAYEYPPGSGRSVAWQFSSLEQVEATFGKNWWERVSYSNRSEQWYEQSVDVLSSADEIIGVTGTFLGFMEEATRQAAIAAGISDPSLVGMIAGDPEWQQIITKAALGQWTDEQIMASLRNTELWQQTLYPGIASLYGRTSEPESAWMNYSNSVQGSLGLLGYPRDPDGSYRSLVGEMLSQGIDDQAWLDMVPTFVRAEQSSQYYNVLDQWTQAELGKPLTFGDWFDVVAGEAAPDLSRVVELAQLQYQSDVTGIGVDGTLLRRIASDADLTEAQAAAAFNSAEQSLLALGDEALGRYGLTKEELVSAATGIALPSGRSIEQVRLLAQKAAYEVGLTDDVNTELFVGFSERGTPERPGLQVLSPERG